MKRSCGILMHISSLPSPYGIGTLGKAAYEFVDFLKEAGQSWWQTLPAGHTSYGDSPYQCFSTFAGNPYFVDLDMLCEDGLLEKDEIQSIDWGSDPTRVDYGRIYQGRFSLLKKAAQRGWDRDEAKVEEFAAQNPWLGDYALFMALKVHFGMKAWTEWEDEAVRLRVPETLDKYRSELKEDIKFYSYIQFLFFKQWDELRAYARKNGVGIIGDIPIYVALDSADVWSEPGSFQLDEKNLPVKVAGVPPDYFSEDGQLWGNPLYDWDEMKRDGYGWWIRRIAGAGKMCDVLRIDHFRGFESYWAVPYGSKTAKIGEWIKGPGLDLVRTLTSWFNDMEFIAEDLGYLTPEVRALLRDSGLPGMKVLEFAFDSREPSNYLPHTYSNNCVCYPGTHDNTTLAGWEYEADPDDVEMAKLYLGLNRQEGFHWGMIRGGLSSVADLFVAQMQDYLGLGKEARMNEPGTSSGNWQWRMSKGQITSDLIQRIHELARIYGRLPEEKIDE